MLTSRALKGAQWRFTWVFLKSILQIALVIVLARFIQPEDFGIAATVALVQKPLSLACMMSLDAAIIQRRNLTQGHIRAALTLLCITTLLTIGLLLLIATPAASFFSIPELKAALQVSAIAFFFGRLSAISRSLLERELRFKRILAIDTVSQLLGYTLPSIFLAVEGYGFWALIVGSILRNAMRSIAFTLAAWNKNTYRPSLAKKEIRELLSFGKGLTLGRIFHAIALRGDYFVISRILGAGDLGIYTRAYKLMNMPGKLFVQVFDKVMFPTMAKMQDDDQTLLLIYHRAMGLLSLLLLPLSAFIIVLAPDIISFTLGSQWLDVVVPLRILLAGTFARECLRISDSLLRAKGITYRSAYRKAIFAFLVVVGSLIGVRYGISGVAVGAVLSLAFTAITVTQLTLGVLKGKWHRYLTEAIPGALLSAIVALLTQISVNMLHSSQTAAFYTITASFLVNILAILLLSHVWPAFFGGTGIWIAAILKSSKHGKHLFLLKKRIF